MYKKVQFSHVLTATFIIENSKSDKKVILFSSTLIFSRCDGG